MIQLKKYIYDQIVAHASRDLPNEACGFLAEKDGIIKHIFEMENIDKSPEHFSFDPAEQFSVFRKIRDAELKFTGNYHSHPATPSRPSVEDIRLAHDPYILYFIVSMASKIPVLKAFKIETGSVENIEINIVD